MEPRVSLITLAVRDLPKARAFYEKLGWRASGQSNDEVVFFRGHGIVLGLFGREALLDDAGIEEARDPGPEAFTGVALAQNQPDRAGVDALMAEAKAAGARILQPAREVFWGGYSGYFSDPEGHVWEVAHNPFWPLDDEGRPTLPD